MRGLFVLVVEDDPDCAAVLSEALALSGYEVGVASTAAQAREQVARRVPDLAIVDGHLGGDAGLEVVRALRRGAFGNGPVILATGMGREEVELEARAAGVDEILVKPIELAVLLEAVARLGGRAASAS
jgi:DNA-binding response OmpR family regulator